MDWDVIINMIFALTIIVTVLTFGTIAGSNSRQHKLERLEIEARIEEAKAAQAAKSTNVQSNIEDRLRVLERIATDPSTDISQQIESLRGNELEAN